MTSSQHQDPKGYHFIIPPEIEKAISSHVKGRNRGLAFSSPQTRDADEGKILPLFFSRPIEVTCLVAPELISDPRSLVMRKTPPLADKGAPQLLYSAEGGANLWARRLGSCRQELKDCGDRDALSAFELTEMYLNFLATVPKRRGLDGRGSPVLSSLHYGQKFGNAFFDGQAMVYGDGDGLVFSNFTRDFTVIAHELSHGLTQSLCELDYQGEPGALNESLSDVLACVAEQWRLKQSAREGRWLIGEKIMSKGFSLRSLASPGRAYVNHPVIGTDPQASHVQNMHRGERDGGGVHLNSGIPNRAFFLFAREVGGNAWELPFEVWYQTLRPSLGRGCTFRDFAGATLQTAGELGGKKAEEAIKLAWHKVGVW